jgi:transposase InsO family protein
MTVHKNARLTPRGRALLVQRVRSGGSRIGDAAAAAGISLSLAGTASGRGNLPSRTGVRRSPDTTNQIERLRRQRHTDPQIAQALSLPRSTVGTVLRRLGLGRLSALEAKPEIVRYEREKPGELIHIDIKKLGRIGHRVTGDRTGHRNKRGIGWEYFTSPSMMPAVWPTANSSRTKSDSAVAFTRRAPAWFKGFGVSVERIMTDNGSAYKSFAFRDLLAEQAIRHKRPRPYTPRTNGKAERFYRN